MRYELQSELLANDRLQQVLFLADLHHSIFRPFGLDDFEHFEHFDLVAVAILYGLTFESVTKYWNRISKLLSESSGVHQYLQAQPLNYFSNAAMQFLIVYLADQWRNHAEDSDALPPAVQAGIDAAGHFVDALGIPIHSIPEVLEAFAVDYAPGAATSKTHIVVRSDIAQAELTKIWQEVNHYPTLLAGKRRGRKSGTWDTYERDVELTRLYEELGDYKEVARRYHELHPHKRLVVSDEITDDVVGMVKKAVWRTRKTMKA